MGTSLEIFFVGKFFRIPNYQRDYAWVTNNVDDLLEDIIEAIETKTSHYVGTFILSKTDAPNVYNVVDGQQRLTTLVMLFNIAIKELGTPTDLIIYRDKFIRSQRDNSWRLELLNSNRTFFYEMLEGKALSSRTKSQALLIEAYNHIEIRIADLKTDNSAIAAQLLEAIQQLEVMEFIESDDGKAIRMFQTVNDRGKPLSNVEKAKSLLIYYSNRFLSGKLDESINEQFGKIFQSFSEIKTIGELHAIDTISQKRFSEDSVMRYHFLAYAEDMNDFNATENYVLDTYLKSTLKSLREDFSKLESFIQDYVSNLALFFECFVNILRRVPKNCKYYKLFPILDLSARLYPLAIRLETRGLLEFKLTQHKGLTLFDLIEMADVRVYKVRGTDPRSDMSSLAKDAKTLSPDNIASRLVSFIDNFMNDGEFARRLNLSIYPNVALRYIFTEYGESLRGTDYPIDELLEQNKTTPTIEHVFSQEQTFTFPNFGFGSIEDYHDNVHTLGNLTLLEKSINSQCRNKTPAQKVADNLYGKSIFEDAKRISAHVLNRGGPFVKGDVARRTKKIADFCMERWRL